MYTNTRTKKYYAVRKGSRIGIMSSWAECESCVKGFKGAEFKSFLRLEDAEHYLNGGNVNVADCMAATTTEAPTMTALERLLTPSKLLKKPESAETLNLYIHTKMTGSDLSIAFVIETITQVYKLFCDVSCSRSDEIVSLGSIAGEVLGAIAGVSILQDQPFNTINLVYKYDGLEKWYNGTWGTNGNLQTVYKETLETLCKASNKKINFIPSKDANAEYLKRVKSICTKKLQRKDVDLVALLQGQLKLKDMAVVG